MTRQILDRLEADGTSYSLYHCPSILPPGDPRWSKCRFVPQSTANGRGYGAAWAVRNDWFYLTRFGGGVRAGGSGLESAYGSEREGDIVQIGMMDVHEVETPIAATWISGDLACSTDPYGDETAAVRKIRLFRIERGRVVADATAGRDLSAGSDFPHVDAAAMRGILDARRPDLRGGTAARSGAPASLPGLAAALRLGSGPDARRTKVPLLWQAGSPDLDVLVAALQGEADADVRRWIAYALGRIGPDAAAAAPVLAAALDTSEDGEGRRALAYALTEVGAPAWALTRVVTALDGVDGPEASDQIGAFVRRMSPADDATRDALIDALRVGRSGMTHHILAHALGGMGPAVVPALTAALRTAPDEAQRAALARALGRIGPAAAPAREALGEALEAARDHDAQRAIADALKAIGLPSADSLAALIPVFRSTDEDGAKASLAALMGSIGAPAVGVLVAEFESAPDDLARRVLADALGAIGAPAAPAIAPLWAATRTSRDGRLLLAAARALSRIGASAKLVLTAQVAAMRHARGVYGRAGLIDEMAPSVIPPDFAIDDLAWLLAKEGDETVGRKIAALLGAMGRPAVAPLRAALSRARNGKARVLIIQALGRIGAPATPALSAVVAALASAGSDRERLQIVDDMRRIGTPAATSLAPLVAVLSRTRDIPVQWRIGLVLAEIGAAAVGPLAALLEATQDDGLRRAAANALGQIGPAAAPAAAALRLAGAGAGDQRTRDIVSDALRRVGAEAAAR